VRAAGVYRRVIELGGQQQGFIAAESQNVGLLTPEIAGILCVRLQLLGDTTLETGELRPNRHQRRKIDLRQAEKFQTIAARAVEANGYPVFLRLIGGQR